MQFYSLTDRGKIREVNEDSCYAGTVGAYTLLILADGMGGHRGGAIASKKAIEITRKILEQSLTGKMLPGQIMLLLSDALCEANREIIALTKNAPTLVGMGTTCDICLLAKNIAYIAHIGDSRIYRFSKSHGTLTKLTKDHSLVEYMIETGTITEEEAIHHPQKNIILRALGTEKEVEVDISHVKLKKGDTLLLCSDGLYKTLPNEEILATILRYSDNVENAAKMLTHVVQSKQRRGQDNTTVAVLKFLK